MTLRVHKIGDHLYFWLTESKFHRIGVNKSEDQLYSHNFQNYICFSKCYFQAKMFFIMLNHEILWSAYLICIPIRSASHLYHIDTHQIISAYQKWYPDHIRMYLKDAYDTQLPSSRLWNFFKNNCKYHILAMWSFRSNSKQKIRSNV